MVNVKYKSHIFSQIFGNYHHKISQFDRKNHKKKIVKSWRDCLKLTDTLMRVS